MFRKDKFNDNYRKSIARQGEAIWHAKSTKMLTLPDLHNGPQLKHYQHLYMLSWVAEC